MRSVLSACASATHRTQLVVVVVFFVSLLRVEVEGVAEASPLSFPLASLRQAGTVFVLAGLSVVVATLCDVLELQFTLQAVL
jgi:hypothetical protein